MPKTYDANVRIRELPIEVDEKLNEIASKRGMHKWEVIRDALKEYAENHG
jgi:hypothetical protein